MASEDLPANGSGGPADHPADPSVAKLALRRAFRAARTAYVAGLTSGERVSLETALASILAAHLPPGTVAAYHAIGDEIDPTGIDRLVAFPRVNRDAALTFHIARRAACDLSRFGVPEPRAAAPIVDPDILLVPLVAIDPAGNRIGYGAGHYDRTLAELRAARRVFAVGVAWDMQLVSAIPADPWDARLDALATPTKWLEFTR